VKEVLFTEIGWFREGPEGWESDGEEQARFIRRLFDLTEDLKPSLLIWSFLYDPEAQPPFDSMGLLDADEAHDEAWEAWTGGIADSAHLILCAPSSMFRMPPREADEGGGSRSADPVRSISARMNLKEGEEAVRRVLREVHRRGRWGPRTWPAPQGSLSPSSPPSGGSSRRGAS